MRLFNLHSIRKVVPALLAVLALVLTAASAVLTWRAETRTWKMLLARRAAALGNFVVPRLERSLATESADGIVRELAQVAVIPDVAIAFVCDAHDEIRYCTQVSWEGLNLSRTHAADAHRMLATARSTMNMQMATSPDNRVLRVAFPLPLPPLPGELRSSRVGIFYLECDLVGHRRVLFRQLAERSAVMGGLAGMLCLGAWLYFHYRYSRRVTALVAAAEQTGRGELVTSIADGNDDELARIGSAFERMSRELGALLANLRASEERFRGAMANSAIGMALVGLDGRWLEVNPALCAIVGYSRAELLERDFQSLTHPADRGTDWQKALQLLHGTASSFEHDKRCVHQTGRILWVRLHVSLLRDEQGNPLHFVTQIQDITVHKRAEVERERLAQAIDAHFDAAYWLDTENRIVYVNEAGCRSVGYTRAELIGCSFSLISPSTTPEALEAAWNKLRTTHTYTKESRHRRKDGSTYPVEIVATLIRIDGKDYHCGFARDISQRQVAEQEFQRQFAELKRWQAVTVGREDRVREMKAEVNELCLRAGLQPRYPSQPATSVSSPADSLAAPPPVGRKPQS